VRWGWPTCGSEPTAATQVQSRLASLAESVTNVVVGFILALLTQVAIFPMFGLIVSTADNLLIGTIFTAVSIVRSFTLRRVFEAVRVRQAKVKTPAPT
jgi:hypothetical protein